MAQIAKTFAEAKALFTEERVVGATIDLTLLGNYPCKPHVESRFALDILTFLEDNGGELPYVCLQDLSTRVFLGPINLYRR